jgi:hypothetical protein
MIDAEAISASQFLVLEWRLSHVSVSFSTRGANLGKKIGIACILHAPYGFN